MSTKIDQRVENHKATVHKGRHYTDGQVAHMQESANRQEKIIGRIFFNNPDRLYGPAQLHKAYGLSWPITSTRRAFTNLTDDGILIKTDKKIKTPHGRTEHQWRWRRPPEINKGGTPTQADMFAGQPQKRNSGVLR